MSAKKHFKCDRCRSNYQYTRIGVASGSTVELCCIDDDGLRSVGYVYIAASPSVAESCTHHSGTLTLCRACDGEQEDAQSRSER
jgi:hypothetical protein